MTPENLGRYEILGELGKGAMGLVYLARDPLIGRQLALKTFRVGYSAEDEELEQFRARFLREAQSAGILSHPNIVTIHDVVVDDEAGAFFIAMEYVKGTDLKQLLQRQQRLAVDFVIDIVIQIARGLAYAHSKGVIHRDIKPANIIITAERQAKITDFGIARVDASNLTIEGQLLGTPNYMAPEQIQGRDVDHRADLFSLGVMLYEMLTGKKPFAGENLTMVSHRIVYEDFTPIDVLVPGLPPGMTTVLDRALRKEPAERYTDGDELAADLEVLRAPVPADERRSGSFLSPAIPPQAAEATPAPAAVPAPPPAPTSAVPPPDPQPHMAPPAPHPSAAETHVARDPVESAATAAPRARFDLAGKPPILRLAVIGVVALLVGGLAAIFLWRSLVDPPQPERADPQLALVLDYLPHVKEGRRLLDEGNPSAAADAFRRALDIVPDDRDVRRLLDRAEREVLQVDGIEIERNFVADQLAAAHEALRHRDYRLAIRLAEQVLELDPENAEAAEVRSDAQRGQRRRDDVRERFRSTPSAPPNEPATERAAAPAQEATLRIEFYSELPEGKITIYAGPEKIYQQPFKFGGGRGGLFRRRPKTVEGRMSDEVALAAGNQGLQIYVWSKGAATETVRLEGNFPPGGGRVLHLNLSAENELTFRLE